MKILELNGADNPNILDVPDRDFCVVRPQDISSYKNKAIAEYNGEGSC
jgi:hypothetical protein